MSDKDLKSLKSRLDSVHSTRKMTNVMKMIAASKLKVAKNKLLCASAFLSNLGDITSALDLTEHLPNYIDNKSSEVLYIVISSSRGLCGNYNSSVYRNFISELKKEDVKNNVRIIFVGKKAHDSFLRSEFANKAEILDVFDGEIPSYYFSSRILDTSLKYGKPSCIKVVFSKFLSGTSFESSVDLLFSLPCSTEDCNYHYDKINFLPSRGHISEVMFLEFIRAKLYFDLSSGYAVETISRMISMENATNNADEVSKDLQIRCNKLRQEKITGEILEIVGGVG
ncbi:F0F1 ATP synthase subunit gamma [Anaplasmataceae bacterium AB001_6]|nr:F0F1 ATP synthase subunit gamma [Anaplasmataceae bacterium AB001_6]